MPSCAASEAASQGTTACRFLVRRGARAGLAILALLFTLAAWAPFLANDRPYVLVATDARALDSARAELVPLADSLAGHLVDGARGQALAEDARALEARLAVIEPAAGIEPLARLRLALARARAGDPVAAAELSLAARAARDELSERELTVRRTGAFPLVSSLDAWDVLAALAPLALAAAVLSRRRLGTRRAILTAGTPAVLLAILAGAARDGAVLTPPGAIKAAIASGSIVVDFALFPPIPFGYAETNLREAWRPPTWLAAAEFDEEGQYVRGARAALPSAGAPLAKPFEPAVDAPFRHVLGTDALGRDVAARVLWGGRRSLAIGAAAALFVFVIGSLLGAAAGFLGGAVDALVSRAIEVVLCFPAFFLVLAAIAWTDPDVVPIPFAIVLVIAAVGWTTTARLVRAEALRVASMGHVLAARALGLHPLRVLVRHVLPNAIGPAIVAFGFAAGGAIGVESSLAFLGLGADVSVPSWGGLVGAARGADQAWAWIAPGAAVFLAVLAWVLVAEAARSALEPREHVEVAS